MTVEPAQGRHAPLVVAGPLQVADCVRDRFAVFIPANVARLEGREVIGGRHDIIAHEVQTALVQAEAGDDILFNRL